MSECIVLLLINYYSIISLFSDSIIDGFFSRASLYCDPTRKKKSRKRKIIALLLKNIGVGTSTFFHSFAEIIGHCCAFGFRDISPKYRYRSERCINLFGVDPIRRLYLLHCGMLLNAETPSPNNNREMLGNSLAKIKKKINPSSSIL